MPTCRRKRVLLTEPAQALLVGDPNKDVYLLRQTGEIFESYEAYAARMSFYRLKQFQCEVTGKSGLDYFQALASEQSEARTMHSRFSEPLKVHVLRAVQWQVMGRLDHLVEAVYERFKDRYFVDEKVYVDVQGDKFLARIAEVFPPKSISLSSKSASNYRTSSLASSSHVPAIDDGPIHVIGGDLSISAQEAITKDDPAKYFYKVQILEEEKDKPDNHHTSKEKLAAKENVKAKWSGSLMEVQCSAMSRDRLGFSKSILRRFIRDCVDRDAAVASPWTVKMSIAERYGVATEMPEDRRKGVEEIKRGEIEKRKKVWEEKEGPPTKKQKKMTAAQEEKVKVLAAAAERREREANEKADKVQKAKDEAERLAAEKKKKKPIRYPTEDLDIRLSEKDKKAGAKVKRPVPSQAAVPFNEHEGAFENFIMTWNFFIVFAQPLHISIFTLDEFERALRHSHADLPCQLLAEVHSTLIYNLRTLNSTRHCAVLSLLDLKERGMDIDEDENCEVTIDQLAAAMADVGNNWERVPLRHSEGREGWEDALVGCLKDHATIYNFPGLRDILTRLLFAPDSPTEPSRTDPSSSSTSSTLSTPTPGSLTLPSTPAERYYALPPSDRVTILAFMCDLAISSKAIRIHMEACEEQLTALRKEKIEVNRQKKVAIEEMNALASDGKYEEEPTTDSLKEEPVIPDSSDLSDVPSESEGGSENGSGARPNSPKKQALRITAQSRHAKARALARAKTASAKQALAEHRRLSEQVGKLERRLEGIEREFRKLLSVARVKPLGKDRFYNRIWWFDGMGAASLIGSGGTYHYGTGRVFVQGPSELDREVLERRDENDVEERRLEEEGAEGMLGTGEWAVYSDWEEVEEFANWLNPKGVRELALKNALKKWSPYITTGMNKRLGELNMYTKLPEARRSTRTKNAGADISREPHMIWTNRKAGEQK